MTTNLHNVESSRTMWSVAGEQARSEFALPNFKDDVPSQEAITLLEAEVHKHENHIAALKTRMNSFTPISRLPAELICKIIQAVRQSYPLRRRSVKWIQLSHVCHAWRDLMIHTASFWTVLPVVSPQWTKEMMLRSKEASLTVVIKVSESDPSSEHNFATALSLLQLSSRIRDLEITTTYFYTVLYLQRFLDILPESAPVLEVLSIGYTKRLDLLNLSWPNIPREREAILPSQSLRNMGHLRVLNANSCRLDWQTHLANMPMLTCLTIHNSMTSNTPTATTFWDALRNMGALQHLELSGALPFVGSAQDDIPGGKVHLPKLLYLKIRGNPNQIAWLLNGVVLRLDPLLDIRCEGSDARSCVVALRALSATLKEEIRSMEIVQYGLNGYAWLGSYQYMPLLAWGSGQIVCAHPFEYLLLRDSYVYFSVTVDHPVPDNPQPLDDLWTTIFRELSLSKVHYAKLHLGAPLSPALLAATLGALPELENLAVTDHFATNIFRALQQDPPVFPVLRRLGLSHNFVLSSNSSRNLHIPSCTYDALVQCLIHRRECELPIRDLSLRGYLPDITNEQKETLRGLVDSELYYHCRILTESDEEADEVQHDSYHNDGSDDSDF